MRFPEYVRKILSALQSEGFAAYAVGGCVRDSLLGLVPHDWDITTSARPEDVLRVFDRPPFATRAEGGLRHGTVTVLYKGETCDACEVTTFRTEGTYSDHRRPDRVEFVGDPAEDLARRDFTVNAMAAAPDLRPDGTEKLLFLDPFGGEADLKAGILRCVGEPERRFEEDALRILRGIRFAARYGFAVEEATGRAMHACAPLLDCIAPERIGAELRGILACDHWAETLALVPDILDRLLPEASPAAETDIWQVQNTTVRLALLCRRCNTDMLREKLLRFSFGKEEADRVIRLLQHRDSPVSTHRDLCFLADVFGRDGIEELLNFRTCIKPNEFPEKDTRDRMERIFAPGVCYSVSTLAVNGRDLILSGAAKPGPELGALLLQLRDLVIDGRLPNEKAALLRAAHSYMK